MDKDIMSFQKSFERCCDCECSCTLTTGCLSNEVWIRSVKRKYDEFEKSGRFYVPGLEILPVARVGIENECVLLRETVSNQQASIQELCLELEEERNAASSAANETMSMILRLQREKAEVLMEARQFKRFVEEKMSHDAKAVQDLEDELYKREQTIHSLNCEIQAYKHRMMSYGLTEAEAEGLSGHLGGPIDYPQLRCNFYEPCEQLEYPDDDVVDIEKYPFEEIPSNQDLKNLEYRINQMEETPCCDELNGDFGSRNILEKAIVAQSQAQSSLRGSKHTRFSTDSSGFNRDMSTEHSVDSPRYGTSFKKLDCVAEELRKSDCGSDFDDGTSDRVYTIDSIHPNATYNNNVDPKVVSKFSDKFVSTPKSQGGGDLGDTDVKKLYLRLQALEADRESMRQTIMSMQNDKAQVMLLREIAQQLCVNMTPTKPMPVQKRSTVRSFSLVAVFKWILSLVCWRKKERQSKYTFELIPDNVGLLLVLDKSARSKHWRCVSSPQVRKVKLPNSVTLSI